jgi:hypothetical protein
MGFKSIHQVTLLILLVNGLKETSAFTPFLTGRRPQGIRHTQLDMQLRPDRRQAIVSSIATILLIPNNPSHALESNVNGKNPFDLVRFELLHPLGGVAVMQKRLDERDFEGLMEFTKEYDQVLRKKLMGNAKKMLAKEYKGTTTSNSITFDLIGINRNCRPRQENYDEAQKYLNELKLDIDAFLSLERFVAQKDDNDVVVK